MIDRRLIERVPGPGRAVKHRLTDRGEQVRAAGASLMGEVLAQSFSTLTEAELDEFGALLRRLLGPLKAGWLTPDCGGRLATHADLS